MSVVSGSEREVSVIGGGLDWGRGVGEVWKWRCVDGGGRAGGEVRRGVGAGSEACAWSLIFFLQQLVRGERFGPRVWQGCVAVLDRRRAHSLVVPCAVSPCRAGAATIAAALGVWAVQVAAGVLSLPALGVGVAQAKPLLGSFAVRLLAEVESALRGRARVVRILVEPMVVGVRMGGVALLTALVLEMLVLLLRR